MTVVVGSKSRSSLCTVYSASIKDTPAYEFSVPLYPGDKPSDPVVTDPEAPTWTKYIVGVVGLMNKERDVPAFNAVITSCVPLGGGVSSSASLEVAMALFVEQLQGKEKRSPVDLALLCQQAEHRYARECPQPAPTGLVYVYAIHIPGVHNIANTYSHILARVIS